MTAGRLVRYVLLVAVLFVVGWRAYRGWIAAQAMAPVIDQAFGVLSILGTPDRVVDGVKPLRIPYEGSEGSQRHYYMPETGTTLVISSVRVGETIVHDWIIGEYGGRPEAFESAADLRLRTRPAIVQVTVRRSGVTRIAVRCGDSMQSMDTSNGEPAVFVVVSGEWRVYVDDVARSLVTVNAGEHRVMVLE